jgi:hypothetical protein
MIRGRNRLLRFYKPVFRKPKPTPAFRLCRLRVGLIAYRLFAASCGSRRAAAVRGTRDNLWKPLACGCSEGGGNVGSGYRPFANFRIISRGNSVVIGSAGS